MSLHDLPWPRDALEHAFGLLREGGRVVVAHPKGAAHVVMQVWCFARFAMRARDQTAFPEPIHRPSNALLLKIGWVCCLVPFFKESAVP